MYSGDFLAMLTALTVPTAALGAERSHLISRRTALQGGAALQGLLGPGFAETPGKLGVSAAKASSSVLLSPSPLVLPSIGIGAWAWGESLFWGYDPKNDFELKELFEYYAAMPNPFFDTAELCKLATAP